MSNATSNKAYTYILVLFASIGMVRAQEVDEVALTFAYPAIGQVYVSAVYRDNQPLLPLSEILHLFMVKHNRIANTYGFNGSFPTRDQTWEVDPLKFIYKVNGERKTLKADQFYISETDLYLTPDLFLEFFKIEFLVDPYALMLTMKKEGPLPIEEYQKRLALRQTLKEQAPENVLKTYPLLYPRKHALFAPGMLDYNVGFGMFAERFQSTYNINAGIELLGGDIQGGISGAFRDTSVFFTPTNIRWRYVFKNGFETNGNPSISEINIGQISLGGPSNNRIRGISVNNNPIVPRRVLDIFAIEGNTVPDSEIELLIGGQLVDFTRADEVGYYRFNTPLTYGTVRIGLRIYTPQGEILYEDRQLQIPFNFVPRGVLTYNFQLGFEEFFNDSLGNFPIGHGDISYGLTNHITLRVGANRLNEIDGYEIKPYASASIRILDQYLVNIESQPERFSRISGSVMYSNNTSLNAQYTEYNTLSLLNILGEQRSLNVNYFLPVTVFNKSSGLRLGIDRAWFSDGEAFNYQVDVNTRIGPIVSRINYREEIVNRLSFEQNKDPNRLATAILTYTVPRKPGVPVFVRGLFLRTSFRHDMKRFDATALGSFQFSQTVFKRGRITLGYDRDIIQKSNTFQVGFLYDFNALRTSTQIITRLQNREFEASFNQTFSGSIGADLRRGIIVPTNRDQVGRAGITVRMFIDNNSNGLYDEGEELVSSKAIRLDQSANVLIGSDGMVRITQLQSYWTYKLTIDVKSLPDPTLMPLKEKFSFVADPNRFKLIDVPLYRTGTIEGFVYRDKGKGKFEPQPGLRLILHREGDEMPLEPIKTFSDGGFYAIGLIPGNYSMVVDSNQLAFMGAIQTPDTLKFTIRTLPEGDYIDTLEIKLIPTPADTSNPEQETLAQLERRLGERLRASVTAFVEAQEYFYRANYSQALRMVDLSLASFTTDFGLALKGSVTYLLGNKEGAVKYWAEAKARNPFISIPDTTQISLRSTVLAQTYPDTLPAGLPIDSNRTYSAEAMAAFEAELGTMIQQSVTAFVEAQELFYRKRFAEADIKIDESLNVFVTDHGLALKGSILYILGRRREAWQIWDEARERNPLISLPDTQILDKLLKPVTQTSTTTTNRSW